MSDPHQPSAIDRLLQAVKRPIRDAVRHRAQLAEQRRWWRTEWSVERDLERVVQSDRTLIVGPWLSEVGYEVLYWVPFLRWVVAAFRLDPSRLVAVSRGGVQSWYAGIASRYVDVWDQFDPESFAGSVAERGTMKQVDVSAFDRQVVKAVERRIGERDVAVLHPSFMFRLLSLYWSGQRPMSFIDSHTRFEPHQAPQVIDPARLPADYVAVKFYAAKSLPDTPEVRRTVATFVAGLAEEMPIVLLNTGLAVDEHTDYPFIASDRIMSARSWMTPQNNLAVQTQIIAGARAFAGTCGSVAWLAPMLGVNTTAVFIDPHLLHMHLPVAYRMYHRMNAAQFAALDLRAFDHGLVGARVQMSTS